MINKINSIAVLILAICSLTLNAETAPVPVGIMPFTEKGEGVEGKGKIVSDLIFSKLVKDDNIWLVERENLEKVFNEQELTLSGLTANDKSIVIGKMAGAKILVTGSVFKVKDETYIVAKVIGTETSRVIGESVNGKEDIDKLVLKLSEKLMKLINEKGGSIVAVEKPKKDIKSEIREKIKDMKRPVLYIGIKEKDLYKNNLDSTAAAVLSGICKDLNFTITDNIEKAQIVIKGTAYSELATQHNNLVSVVGGLEVKVTDKEKNIIASLKKVALQVGLAESTTGKKAIEEATNEVAKRILPAICKH